MNGAQNFRSAKLKWWQIPVLISTVPFIVMRQVRIWQLWTFAHSQTSKGVVVHCAPGVRVITATAVEKVNVTGKAVLFHTGWDAHWRTEAYSSSRHPFLTGAAAEYLAYAKAALVGIDSYNIDNTDDGQRPAHSILLAQAIPIVEHLCGLGALPESGFRFFAVPPKMRQVGSFPVRAFAVVSDKRE